MSQADSPKASAAVSGDADVAAERTGSWWRTLPGMFTAAATLISAITGLVVAVQQLRPSDHPAAQTGAEANALSTSPANQTSTGGTSQSSATLASRVSFPVGRHAQVNGLRYDILSATTRVSNPGQLSLALEVKLSNPGGYDANLWSRTFRLRVGSDTSAPTNLLDDLVHGGTAGTGEVDFALPAATRVATLLVGDDPSNAIALPISFGGRA